MIEQSCRESSELYVEIFVLKPCSYMLQSTDINLLLIQYALEQDKVRAKEYTETALKLATCDDGPPYYYKVAPAGEEAERFLEQLAG